MMSDTEIILSFVRACARGNLGFSECSPVFVFGGIVLAALIMGITLAVLLMSRAKTQTIRQDRK